MVIGLGAGLGAGYTSWLYEGMVLRPQHACCIVVAILI
jgi:hypothetical protein